MVPCLRHIWNRVSCPREPFPFICICSWINAQISGSSWRKGLGSEASREQSGEKQDLSLLVAGAPLSTVCCLTLDVHLLLPCQHVRCEEHPNRSTWPKLNKFSNCSKTALEGVVTTENHTHGQIRSTWLHLMPPNVPRAWLSHQVPPAKSCCWGAGFGTPCSWGGVGRGEVHTGAGTRACPKWMP